MSPLRALPTDSFDVPRRDLEMRPDLDRTEFVSALVDDRLPFEVDLLAHGETMDSSADFETVATLSIDDFVGETKTGFRPMTRSYA